jgi:hypothetical protein
MALMANALQVVIIICTAIRLWDAMVNVCTQGLMIWDLEWINANGITLEDVLTLATPKATIAALGRRKAIAVAPVYPRTVSITEPLMG